jgi:hypothetical protein
MLYIDKIEFRPTKLLYYNNDLIEARTFKLTVRYIERLLDYNINNYKVLHAIKTIISLEVTQRFKDKNKEI